MLEPVRRLRLPSRDTLIGMALLLALGIVVLLTASQGNPEQPYRLDSTGRDGLQALSEWLQGLGHPVEQTGAAAFDIPDGAELLFVYPGRQRFTEAEAGQVAAWIAAGHTAVLVNAGENELELQAALQMTRTAPLDLPALGPAQQRAPLLAAAPANLGRLGQPGRQYPAAPPGSVVALATGNGEVTAVVSTVGRGTVWHLSAVHALTNADLRDGNGGYLALAVLRTVPPGGRVLFDTYHQAAPAAGQAVEPSQIQTLQDWLYRTPPGWAVLLAAALLLAGLALGGRRLGPALPVAEAVRRREAVEHVAALAALQRRAQQRRAVAHHHQARLKAALARRVHLSPDLPDADLVAGWSGADPAATPLRSARARHLLASLATGPDEADLVRLVGQVDQLLAQIGNV